VNEHDETVPRARKTRKSRALKRPSRWLEKRSGALSSRPTSIPGDLPECAPDTVAPVVPLESEADADDAIFDEDAADFFRVGESAPPLVMLEVAEDHEAATGRPAAASALAVAAAERRRAFSRHVLGVVVLSVVVCIAAFVRSATGAPSTIARAAPAAMTAASPVVAPVEARVALVAAVAPVTPEPAAVPDVARERSPAAARVAREEARRLLEGGAAAAATAAAIRSVELDPTDAEAWLILGAAYQLAGDGTEARNAFRSCSKLATHGGVGECRAFVP
jgi:hypothetical protein